MKIIATRTLMKSAPELWELADDLARMEAWMAGLVGAAAAAFLYDYLANPRLVESPIVEAVSHEDADSRAGR